MLSFLSIFIKLSVLISFFCSLAIRRIGIAQSFTEEFLSRLPICDSTCLWSAIRSFSTTKSNGTVLRAFLTFAFLVVTYNSTGRAMQQVNRSILHMDDINRVNYCSNRACPNWKCQDDSTIIQGTCCWCPNIFGGISKSDSKKMSKVNEGKFSSCNCEQAETMLIKNQPTTNIETKIELKRSSDLNDVKFDDFDKEVNSMQSSSFDSKTLKTENEKISNENKYIASNEISTIKFKPEIMEKINFRKFVYIKGIPPTENENLPEIVEKIGLKTNTEIKVEVATRLYMNNSSRSVIVAQLETIEMKRNLISNSITTQLTANNILNNWPTEDKIYIEDRLTIYR